MLHFLTKYIGKHSENQNHEWTKNKHDDYTTRYIKSTTDRQIWYNNYFNKTKKETTHSQICLKNVFEKYI